MTHIRNTREAPDVGPLCTVCGASRLDGNGSVRPLHGHMQCKRCRQGAQQLVKHEPDRWRFGDDGRLEFIGDRPAYELEREKDAIELHKLVQQAVGDLDGVTVEAPQHRMAFTSVILPNGYRWHVYPKHNSENDVYTVRLFTALRQLIPGAHAKVAEDTTQAMVELRDLVQDSITGGMASGIEADELARRAVDVELEHFNPEDLLKGAD